MSSKTALTGLLGCLLLASINTTLAETYPSRTVRLVVSFAPGGNNDIPSRILATKVAGIWKTPIVVDNRAGAGGTIGTAYVAKAAPDGYTLANCNSATHGVNPALYKKLPYNAVTDFSPVSLIATAPNVLLVGPNSPMKTMNDFLAFAKANPGKLSIGTAGVGSTQHFSTELLKSMTGTDIVHVPYKGGSLALSDLMGGQIPAAVSGLPTALTAIKAGKVRALAVTAAIRSPQLPNVPTFAESGVPGYEVVTWTGVCAPAGTPRDVIVKIQENMAKALEMPETKRLLAEQGMDAVSSSPEKLAVLIKTEVEKFTKLVKDAGIPQEQ